MFQEPHLTGDLVSMARPVTKWSYDVNHGADLPQALRRAYKVKHDPDRHLETLPEPVR